MTPSRNYSQAERLAIIANSHKNALKRRSKRKYRHTVGDMRVCPACQTAPCHVTAGGYVDAYCKPCKNKRQMERRKGIVPKVVENKTCPMCKQADRLISSSGRMGVYCRVCENKRQMERHIKDRALKKSGG